MPVENTEVRLVNEALLRLASEEITSLDDDTQKADICERSYNAVVTKLLAMRQWRFATRKFELSRLVDTPIGGWKYAFQIPAEAFNHDSPWAVYSSDAIGAKPHQRYEVFEDTLLANDEEAFADFTVEPLVAKFPPAFRELTILALCEVLAPPITEKPELAAYWGERAFGTAQENYRGGFFRVAAQADARGNPSPAFQTDEIVAARLA